MENFGRFSDAFPKTALVTPTGQTVLVKFLPITATQAEQVILRDADVTLHL